MKRVYVKNITRFCLTNSVFHPENAQELQCNAHFMVIFLGNLIDSLAAVTSVQRRQGITFYAFSSFVELWHERIEDAAWVWGVRADKKSEFKLKTSLSCFCVMFPIEANVIAAHQQHETILLSFRFRLIWCMTSIRANREATPSLSTSTNATCIVS